MSAKVKIIGENNSSEGRAAKKLKEIFERGLDAWVTGDIYIIPNVKLVGQKIKDIDIVVFGRFTNQKYPVKYKHQCTFKKWGKLRNEKTGIVEDKVVEDADAVDVKVSSFCFTIELKNHDPSGVSYVAEKVWVMYNGTPEDVSEQSYQQAIALKDSLLPSLSPKIHPVTKQEKSPFLYVNHAIWLYGFSSYDELTQLFEDPVRASVLPRDFKPWDLFEIGIADNFPMQARANTTCFWSIGLDSEGQLDESSFQTLAQKYTLVKASLGRLTRDKLEKITTRILKEQKYASEIGNKLVIFSGRAGTGKTIKLLRIAVELALDQDKTCLLLTYNNALVADVLRLLHLADLPDGASERTVHVQTLDFFFFHIAHGLGLCSDFLNFDKERDSILNKLVSEWIKPGILKREDLFQFVQSGDLRDFQVRDLGDVVSNVVYDYVMVDECQDWGQTERDVLLALFGANAVVVADGVDQMIRRPYHLNWAEGLSKDQYYKPPREKVSLRQKSNLVEFERRFAELSRLPDWEVLPRETLPGGSITVIDGEYVPAIHRMLYADCETAGNKAYEMMILVPPSFVTKVYEEIEEKRVLTKTFTKLAGFDDAQDIKFWDATSKDVRRSYPSDVDEFRLLQYDSCRGLEGWTVVCLNFDEFVEHKDNMVKENPELRQQDGQIMMSLGEFAHEYAHRWGMIPLTRAVDHLVLTLRNPNSEVGKILRQIADENPDFVYWRNSSEFEH